MSNQIETSIRALAGAIKADQTHAIETSARFAVHTLEKYNRVAVQWIAPLATHAVGRLKTHSFRLDVVEARVVQLGERKQIDRGPPGPPGPMPEHEWDGTRLRFQQGPDGHVWGRWTDLVGPPGRAGGYSAMGLPMYGGGGSTTATQNSYFPAGW